MSALGLLMFGVAMLLMIVTGLPVYAVLLGVGYYTWADSKAKRALEIEEV